MTALGTLAVCVIAPWLACTVLRGVFGVDRATSPDARERALRGFRGALLVGGALLVPACAALGALFSEPLQTGAQAISSAWFFSSVCGVTAWATLALRARTPDEARAMPAFDTVGRVVQMAFVPAAAVAWSLLSFGLVDAWIPMIAPAKATLGALVSVAGVLVAIPWLAMQLGLWRRLPIDVDSARGRWSVAHLPAPSPTLTHAASVPWLRTVLVSDRLLADAAERDRDALIDYELGQRTRSPSHRVARWAVAILSSMAAFIVAHDVGPSDPRRLVAATVLAVAFTAAATWFTHREPGGVPADTGEGPSMEQLAHTLRRLPPRHGQALPRTWHRPVSKALYDRLFALGHDPGRRCHR